MHLILIWRFCARDSREGNSKQQKNYILCSKFAIMVLIEKNTTCSRNTKEKMHLCSRNNCITTHPKHSWSCKYFSKHACNFLNYFNYLIWTPTGKKRKNLCSVKAENYFVMPLRLVSHWCCIFTYFTYTFKSTHTYPLPPASYATAN